MFSSGMYKWWADGTEGECWHASFCFMICTWWCLIIGVSRWPISNCLSLWLGPRAQGDKPICPVRMLTKIIFRSRSSGNMQLTLVPLAARIAIFVLCEVAHSPFLWRYLWNTWGIAPGYICRPMQSGANTTWAGVRRSRVGQQSSRKDHLCRYLK